MTNGIINVYKEKGYTSFDVVARLRGIYHQKKIGHTGTLDPDAEGVLPVCLGKATRVCELLTDKDKEYEAVLLLGLTTDTQDLSGTVLSTAPVEVSREEVAAAIQSFVGAYDQIPPMYSALKVGGQKLCDLARKGVTVERKARRVHIYGIEILEMNLPEVTLRVSCSKGTYIRTLCQDIGEKLGCGGCMKSLVRTKVSDFLLTDAHRIAEIEAAPQAYVRPVDTVFLQYPKAVAVEGADKLLLNGNRLPEAMIADLSEEQRSGTVRLYDSRSNFIGLYAYQPDAKDFKPIKLFME
jgi:tRNA pseudouridine55 synthase